MGVIIIISVLLLAGLAILFFSPKRGIWVRLKSLKSQVEKVFLEDSLKHLYDCEYNKIDCSLNSLSGSLNIVGEKAAKLISRLEEMNLVKSQQGKLKLTNEGRTYALRIIRVHRLWEKYLADHTSVKETDWHNLAEAKEHLMSSEEINQLAARLGNPLRDPHGDPIPSATGEMPAQKGIRLNELPEGAFAKILHVEDEPKEVYAQLIAQRLFPGMQIKVIESSKERIRFDVEGEESVLAPILANNVSVLPLGEEEEVKRNFETLSSVEQGELAVVVGLSNALRGQQRRRLLDFGFVPGTKIQAQLKSLSGDPTAYEVRGSVVALRKNQTDHIYIKKIKKLAADEK